MGWLESALERGFAYRELRLDPILDPVRESERFQEILAAMDTRSAALRDSILAQVPQPLDFAL